MGKDAISEIVDLGRSMNSIRASIAVLNAKIEEETAVLHKYKVKTESQIIKLVDTRETQLKDLNIKIREYEIEIKKELQNIREEVDGF